MTNIALSFATRLSSQAVYFIQTGGSALSNTYIHTYIYISLSTLVLNSRDWSEIVWLPEISRFKINLAISFIRKKPAGMHWLSYNDAVSSLNEAKTRIFPTANFENFEIHLYFVSQPACLPASQPAVRPGCARCSAPEISHDKGNGGGFTKCCSEDDLPTVPCYPSFSFLVLLYSFSKV